MNRVPEWLLSGPLKLPESLPDSVVFTPAGLENSPVKDELTVGDNFGLCAHCGEVIPSHPYLHTWISSDVEGKVRFHIDRPLCRIASGDPMPGTKNTTEEEGR